MSQARKVIIVDDSLPIRKRLRQFVESAPCCAVVAEANCGRDAVDLILSIKPDVVTLDIKMPDITGVEVLQRIQSVVKDITVIVVSNYTSEPYKSKCMTLGADYYLDKSRDFEQINAILGL